MSKQQNIVDRCEGLSGQILALDPRDKEAIVQIGASVEEMIQALPDGSSEADSLLALALNALQAVYEEKFPADSEAVGMIAEAVLAAGQNLTAQGSEEAQDSARQITESLGSLLAPAEDEPPAQPQTEQVAVGGEPGESAESPQESQADPSAEASGQPPEAPEGPPTLPEDADLELLAEFIVECVDHITGAEAALLDLESNPEVGEQINIIFRAFHTIKGTSAFLGLDRIQKLAHLAESLLDRAREGQIRVTGGYADLALKSCDTLRTMIEALDGVKPGGNLEIPDDYDTLMTELRDPEAAGIGEETEEAEAVQMRVGDILVAEGAADRKAVEEAADRQQDELIGKVLAREKIASATDVAQALRVQKKIRGKTAAEATVRVGTGRLDNLINMVGELVIAQSMVAQDSGAIATERPRLVKNVAHAGKIIRELQDLTMSLRMVPLKGTFQKMARLVRDLARKAGKPVQFVTDGEETEIDRNMVEELNDPLVHMIRNAVDHGIEAAEQRTQTGKPPTGTVCLRAYHSAGNVVIELEDDGKGLDRDKIIAKAVERGLIKPGRELTEGEVFNLILQPGFSTAEKVTAVSGRGVGMDVVKKGIEALHGRIDVSSEPGAGSKFTLRVPLTMAITDAMFLGVGEERYMLPTGSIEHSFRPKPGSVSTVVGRGEMVMLRGNLLPLFRLHKLFSVANAATDPYEALLVVIEGEGRRCALMVDEVLGQQQVVVKTLGQSLGRIQGSAGGTILGDGRVGLILDAVGIIKLATEQQSKAKAAKAA